VPNYVDMPSPHQGSAVFSISPREGGDHPQSVGGPHIDFKRLHLDNAGFLSALLVKNGGRVCYARVMVVCIDFEWYLFGGRNVLLSVQVAVISPQGSRNHINYTAVGERLRKGLSVVGHIGSSQDALNERLTLEGIVELAVRIDDGGSPLDRTVGKTRVLLVIHNSVAEWSMLRDRDEDHIVKRLTAIRKSPVTGVHPIKLYNQMIGFVDLEIFDTRLLAPAKLQSLDKLSALLGEGEKKIEVSEAEKRNMDQFLQKCPARFEEYALRDTEVTAKLFFLLQRLLNELAFGDEAL